MAVHSVVSDFCNGISSDIDDAVVEYLTGVVDDACNDECADISGIEELVQGFLPDIANLSQQERHERLWTLLTKVSAFRQNGSPTKAADLQQRPACCGPLDLSAALGTSQGQQRMQQQEEGGASLNDRECSHSEEHQQALAMLSALWPPDVPMSQAFIAAILDTQCQGDLEAAATWLLECPDVARQQMLWQKATQEDVMRREAAAQKEKEARKKLVSRFALETKSTPSGQPRKAKGRGVEPLAPWSEADKPSQGKQRSAGVRYRDGFPVASKGEKHVEVALKEEWNGGSSGKIYTKGKRGKGFV